MGINVILKKIGTLMLVLPLLTFVSNAVEVTQAQQSTVQGQVTDAVTVEDRSGIDQNNVASMQETVRGHITDAQTGESLPGVNILIEGTTTGTITDADGNFELTVSDLSSTLIITYIGYNRMEIPLEGRVEIDIEMTSQVIVGEDLVVVGYGTQQRETLTGSVSAVEGSQMIKTPTVNVTNNLAGRLSGLQVVTETGEPGNDDSIMRIRGSSTLGDNSPLVVVDGIPGRELARINPNSIESINVLKDASAAIYGSKAANGVILVTTKRGSIGAPQISIDFNQGWSAPTVIPDMADAASYAQMINEINMYSNQDPVYSDEDIQKYADGSDPWTHPNTDWFDEVIKPLSPQTMANVSLSGGSEAVRYFTSLGYRYQDGIFYDSATNYSQVNIRSNIDATVTENITINLGLAARQEDRGNAAAMRGARNNWWALNRQYPYLPAYWPTGEPGPDVEYGTNPAVTTTNTPGYENDKRYGLEGTLQLDVTIPAVEGLSFSADVNIDKVIDNNKFFIKPWVLYTWDGNTRDEDGVPVLEGAERGVSDPQLEHYMGDATTTTIKGLLNYVTTIGEMHNIGVLVGAEQITGDAMNFSAFRRHFPSTQIDELFAGGEELRSNTGSSSQQAQQSLFSRLNYNYANRYMIEAVFRYDGSYVFPEDDRWGFFPGVSLGWDVAGENFWNFDFINQFKLRGSWGRTGNDRITPYQYMETFAYSGDYIFNIDEVHKQVNQTRTPNRNITWEVADQKNIGFDSELFDGRIQFSAEYFYETRSNILWWRDAAIPQHTGLTLPQENFAKVRNSGVDLQLGFRGISEDFNYAITLSADYAKNKILDWDEPEGRPEHQRSEGRPMGSQLYYNAIGVFRDWDHVESMPSHPEARPGDLIFEDVNGDGVIDGNDRIRIDKTDMPTLTGGVNVDLGYRNFDASFLIQGAAGAARAFREFSGEAGNFRMDNVRGRWTPDNIDADKPRAWNRSAEYWMTDGQPNNTYWVRNTDYLRLKSINIGYTLPVDFMGADNFRIYVSGQNLLTLTSIKDFDPESPSQSDQSIWVNSQVYPHNKTYSIGMTINF
jgi:TonB-dependent starch-binding outer membrane protein SusC